MTPIPSLPSATTPTTTMFRSAYARILPPIMMWVCIRRSSLVASATAAKRGSHPPGFLDAGYQGGLLPRVRVPLPGSFVPLPPPGHRGDPNLAGKWHAGNAAASARDSTGRGSRWDKEGARNEFELKLEPRSILKMTTEDAKVAVAKTTAANEQHSTD